VLKKGVLSNHSAFQILQGLDLKCRAVSGPPFREKPRRQEHCHEAHHGHDGPAKGAGGVELIVCLSTWQNYFAQMGTWVIIIQGAIFVACVLIFSRGIIGELDHWRQVYLWRFFK
jgi:hypothetical protein